MVGSLLVIPIAGLSLADVTLAASECAGNRTKTAGRLGVAVRSLDYAVDRFSLQSLFVAGRGHGVRPWSACVTQAQVQEMVDGNYLREDAALLLGISKYYLRDLCHRWGVSFAGNRSVRIKIGKKGYCHG